MEKMDECNLKKDINKLIKICGIFIFIYIGIKWVLPLIWPVAVGFVIAKCLEPVANLLSEKIKMSKKISSVLVIIAFALIVGGGGFYILKILASQARRLMDNWENIYTGIDGRVMHLCSKVEENFSMNRGAVYSIVSKGFAACLEQGKGKVVSLLMDNSFSGCIWMIEVLVAVIISVVSVYYFLTKNVEIKLFKKQIMTVKEHVKHIFKAFVRAQVIIMIIDIVVCFIGFSLLKNPYSLLIAVGAGIMDALPMIGIGLVLIPWILASVIAGSTQKAIVLFVVFMICYIVREVLEPKLIGENIGLSPVMSLLTLFAGYKLFGIIGLFAGPLIYMIVVQSENSEKV
ncbi:MAG: AI-2E family transporter [Lachnospiraceae bacterium]|nr:AI-2E family transporter [Lachnospiraceae bacterium]